MIFHSVPKLILNHIRPSLALKHTERVWFFLIFDPHLFCRTINHFVQNHNLSCPIGICVKFLLFSFVLILRVFNYCVKSVVFPCIHIMVLGEFDDHWCMNSINHSLCVGCTIYLSKGTFWEAFGNFISTLKHEPFQLIYNCHVTIFLKVLL